MPPPATTTSTSSGGGGATPTSTAGRSRSSSRPPATTTTATTSTPTPTGGAAPLPTQQQPAPTTLQPAPLPTLRLTKADREEGYLSETLVDALEANHTLRHLARIAHLYVARERLSQVDVADALPRLLDKAFGANPADGVDLGWSGKVSDAIAPLPLRSVWTEIVSHHDATFSTAKYSKEQIGVFRLVELLHPLEPGNLFELAMLLYAPAANTPLATANHRALAGVPFRFHVADLPRPSQTFLKHLLGGNAVAPGTFVPGLFDALSTFRTFPDQRAAREWVLDPGLRGGTHPVLLVDFAECLVLRLVSWFGVRTRFSAATAAAAAAIAAATTTASSVANAAANPSTNANASAAAASDSAALLSHLHLPTSSNHYSDRSNETPLIARAAPTSLLDVNVRDVCASQPMMELLLAWMEALCPPASDSPAPHLAHVFREAAAEFWLNIEAAPTLRVVHAAFLLVCHLHSDPRLMVPVSSVEEAMVRTTPAAARNASVRGLTPPVAELRLPLLRFFRLALSAAPLQRPPPGPASAGMNAASLGQLIELWSVVLQPWKAARKCHQDATKRTSILNFLRSAAAAHSPSGVLTASSPSHTNANSSANSSVTANATEDSFTAEWTWFVVQHYLLYVAVLHEILHRMRREAAAGLDALESLVRAFGADEVFSDGVVAVLLAAEKAALGEPCSPLDVARTAGGGSSLLPPRAVAALSSAERSPVLDAVRLIHDQRELVRASLNAQAPVGAAVFGYATPALPSLRDKAMQDDASNALKQLWFARKEASARRKHAAKPKRGGAAASDTDGAERLRLVFNVPAHDLSDAFGERDEDAVRAAPAAEVVYGAPRWLASKAAATAARFPYTRLSFLGARQLRTGERAGRPELAAQYLGDPILHPAPVCTFEVPWMVTASLGVSRLLNAKVLGTPHGSLPPTLDGLKQFGFNLRFAADVRNLCFAVVVLALVDALLDVAGGVLLVTAPLSMMFFVGAASLRGPAAVAWAAVHLGVARWMLSTS